MPLQRLVKSFAYAFRGIGRALGREQNLRIHLGASFAVIALGLILELELSDWAILILTMGLVIALELANTALEAAVELSIQEFHPLAGLAKDVAAGAVLVASIAAAVVGILILGPHLLARLGHYGG